MSLEDEFQKSLALGEKAENIVYNYLIEHNSYVQDLRKQKHADKKGPRLVGTEGELVLPDFAVYNKDTKKGNFAIDVKYKKSIYSVKGTKCFTVDAKFEDYRRVTAIMKLDFLKIVFSYKDKMYFYKDSDCIGTTNFTNRYGSGNVYLFEFDTKMITY